MKKPQTRPGKTKKVVRKSIPKRASEVLVTQSMLYGVRNELIENMNSRFHKMDAKFDGVKSEIHGVKSEIHNLASKVDRTLVLMEEQNAKNNVVMDLYLGVAERQDKLENDQKELRSIIIKPPREV